MEICGDNRFEIIAKAKEHLLDATNIDTSEDEMKVIDSFLYRCWQMGWLDRYAEPNCEECKHFNEKSLTYMKQCKYYFMECRFEPKIDQTDCAWK